MAKTQDLKRRIRSVRNTMQLTKAMKMVAAAKLRRAQETMMAARPYSHGMLRVLRSLVARAEIDEGNPLLQSHGDRRLELVVVTGDKGLCGGFNASIIREATQFGAAQVGAEISINAVGKKGRDLMRSTHNVTGEWVDVFRKVEFATAKEIAKGLMERYVAQDVDKVYLVFNEFKSAIQAKPIVHQLLPIESAELEGADSASDYIYEPSAEALFAKLIPSYVENQVYRAMLESAAAEHAARMTAMDAATSNAGELIESLTLTMNRVRQASITTEIIEVVSGAEALG
jgi:F-type H+-transporting ATPase subunit gamma